MRSRVPLVVLTLSGVLLLIGFRLLQTSPSARAERERAAVAAEGATHPGAEPPAAVQSVDAIVARADPGPGRVELAAVLEAVRRVVVGAEIAGKVVEIVASEHDHVAADELLVRLDPELPQAALDRARASLVRSEASARLARAELRRQRDLSDRGVASAAELDRAQSEAATHAAQVAEAQAARVEAETLLAKTRILAPFAGVVTKLDLEPGAYLQPGSPVAELVDLSEIEIEVQVGDRQLVALHADDPVDVSVDVFPGERFPGRIHRLGRAPDARTRKYPVPVRVANPEERLLPGMLGTVRFEVGGDAPTLAVPRSALRREFELDYLFVLEGSEGDGSPSRARRRRVTVKPVPFRPDLVEVVDGLASGELVAISGVRELRDGLLVQPLLRGEGS
ncbi:MAG: efflux RND transporter periplasmic adaptor subunit [Myxococcota bacterium]